MGRWLLVIAAGLLAPCISLFVTDARAYAHLCSRATYRFMPVLLDQAAIETIHGTNERLRTSAYPLVVRFYAALIRNMQ